MTIFTEPEPKPTLVPVKCKIYGDYIKKSFDDEIYNITACNHILAEDKVENSWQISCK